MKYYEVVLLSVLDGDGKGGMWTRVCVRDDVGSERTVQKSRDMPWRRRELMTEKHERSYFNLTPSLSCKLVCLADWTQKIQWPSKIKKSFLLQIYNFRKCSAYWDARECSWKHEDIIYFLFCKEKVHNFIYFFLMFFPQKNVNTISLWPAEQTFCSSIWWRWWHRNDTLSGPHRNVLSYVKIYYPVFCVVSMFVQLIWNPEINTHYGMS